MPKRVAVKKTKLQKRIARLLVSESEAIGAFLISIAQLEIGKSFSTKAGTFTKLDDCLFKLEVTEDDQASLAEALSGEETLYEMLK